MTVHRGAAPGHGAHLEPPGTGAPAVDQEPDAADVARTIALRLLSAAPRSRSELAGKLADRGVSPEVSAVLLDRFEEVGLLDDVAYAEMIVRTRQSERGLAGRALKSELHRKGIDGAVAEAALASVQPEDEEQAARRLVDRRIRSTRGVDPVKRRRRLVDMLARKGYSPSVAWRVVDEVLASDGGDENIEPFDDQGWRVADS